MITEFNSGKSDALLILYPCFSHASAMLQPCINHVSVLTIIGEDILTRNNLIKKAAFRRSRFSFYVGSVLPNIINLSVQDLHKVNMFVFEKIREAF